ncbi:MAG: response regulator, partial [Methanomassiliicoccales archaeon]
SGDIEVDTICSPKLALSKCCDPKSPYDVIISDYQMPEMNGIELLKQLRTNGITSPFILFTGRGREEIVIEALNSGADLYLQKGGDPVAQFGELANSVRQLYMRNKAERDLMRSSSELAILFDASSRLVGENDMSKIYEVIGDATQDLMQADDLIVSSYDEMEKIIRCAYCWNGGVPVDIRNFPPIPLEEEGKGIQSQAIRSGRSMLIEDYQELLHHTNALFYFNEEGKIFTREEQEQNPGDEITRSSLIVPLKYREQVVGVIQVHSSRLANFTEHDLKLVESLAGHAASAIAVARYREAQSLEAEQREITERRLRILEAVMDSSDEMIVIWRVKSDGIRPLCCNKNLSGTVLDEVGQLDLDHALRDAAGNSLDKVFRDALEGFVPPTPLQGQIRRRDGSWMPLTFRLHPAGGEAVIIRAMP